ncbi:nuclear envelope phosphatase-regulatory subunit 1 isoform X1 [Octopus bimaculoides]|uniref:nuclear envelope phosphatase-regulatory subunit 1 isoform X1 n=1 Tax=Octopus bimaculoides TaxID=37653 RepID=UPI0022DED825|nr:nuclear envelope phosphatase-regulatory subunit 1 isoform X1 [Octopus bimaculoides]
MCTPNTSVYYRMWPTVKKKNMSFEQTEDDYVRTLQDLKAFERRLTEVIDKLQPAARFWRIILIITSVCTAIGAWAWLWDPATAQISFIQSLWNHPFFTISCITLLALFVYGGIHKRVVAPSIVASRCRQVLSDYNMSCDDTGKLILLKPRPSI